MKDIILYIMFPYGIVAIVSFLLMGCFIAVFFMNRKKKPKATRVALLEIAACFLVFAASFGVSCYFAQDLILEDHIVIEEIRYSDNHTPSVRHRRMRPMMTEFTFTTKTDSVTVRAQNTVLPQMNIGSMYKIRYAKRTKVLLQATEIPEEKIDINKYINENRFK